MGLGAGRSHATCDNVLRRIIARGVLVHAWWTHSGLGKRSMKKTLVTIVTTVAVMIFIVSVNAQSGQFDPLGKAPTKGFVAVEAYKWIRDNAPDAIKNCKKHTDQYDDLHHRSVSKFKREAINCLASVGFFNNWPLDTIPTTTTVGTTTTTSVTATTTARLSDAQIRQLLIDRSITAYPGSCACPYNRARDGSRCGARSAWSKPGGASPLCYTSDVTQAMVDRYRRQHQ